MPSSVRLALVALALAALPSSALAAPAAPHGHVHHRRPSRRAKLDVPAARAPRSGASLAKVDAPPKPPAEQAESVGSPNEGHLQGGVHLDMTRPYFHVNPSSGDVRWGLPVLISMIDRAARAVYKRYPGAALEVGDISKKGGGDLLQHHSHESGRDADLGFYAVDAKGKQILSPAFIRFDASGQAPAMPGARFDLDRNWTLIQEMLTDPAARVSHIFIAEPLRQRLLAHAKSRGVSRALLDRAAVVMMQPTHSLPHDNHMHVRISCPASMRGSCVELARNAPHSKARVAHKERRVLRTPGKHLPAPGKIDGALAHGKKPAPALEPRIAKGKPPPAAGTAPQEPFTLELPEGDEADTDAADLKDTADESGAPKIMD